MENESAPNLAMLMKAMANPLAQLGKPGQIVDPSNPQTMQNNPAIQNAMGSMMAYGGMSPLMAGMMGSPMTNGFSITHVSVQPSPQSLKGRKGMTAAQRHQKMVGQRESQVQSRQANAIARNPALGYGGGPTLS